MKTFLEHLTTEERADFLAAGQELPGARKRVLPGRLHMPSAQCGNLRVEGPSPCPPSIGRISATTRTMA